VREGHHPEALVQEVGIVMRVKGAQLLHCASFRCRAKLAKRGIRNVVVLQCYESVTTPHSRLRRTKFLSSSSLRLSTIEIKPDEQVLSAMYVPR
jgi:hypothetical protein